MNTKAIIAGFAVLFLIRGVGAQEPDRNTYYWAEDRQVRVSIEPSSVAVRFSTTPDNALIASVARQTNTREDRNERYLPFRRHRTVVYSVPAGTPLTNRYLAELQRQLATNRAPVADVGRLVTTESGAVGMMPQQLSIGFIEGVTGLGDFSDLAVRGSVSEVRRLSPGPLVISYQVNADANETALEIANAVYEYRDARGRRLVTYAAPTMRFPAELRTVPNQPRPANDPLYPTQWHLNHQTLADVDAPEAWDYTRGSKDVPPPERCTVAQRVRVAVLDNGVLRAHEDLVDNVAPGHDYMSNDNDPNPDGIDPVTNPDPQHGTQAAGVIAACGDNKIGVSGICPLCQIVPMKIDMFAEETVRDALHEAVYVFGVDVISNSWGVYPSPQLVGILATITGTNPPAAGVPVFFAATNAVVDVCSTDVSGLASVIAVSGSSIIDRAGLSGGFGTCIDLVAPTQQGFAGKVVTTNIPKSPPLPPNAYGDTYSGFGGTSSATALAAGIAGLVLSLNPALTQEDVRNILEHTAEKITLVPMGEQYVNGFSPRAGYGRVNAHRAVVPVVKISTSDADQKVQVNQPFEITVSASAPYLLSSIGLSRNLVPCKAINEEWRTVASKAFAEEKWTVQLPMPGIYIFRPNAKDKMWPQIDGYPHIASDAFVKLPELVIEVQGEVGRVPTGCVDTR